MKVNRYVLAGLALALFASLAGNIFLSGLALGHAAKPLPGPPEIVALGPILKSLPEADRKLMHRVFAQHKQEVKKATDAAKISGDAVQKALVAQPYDAERLKTALVNYRRDFLTLRGTVHDVFWEGATEISPEARKKLAESPAFKKLEIK